MLIVIVNRYVPERSSYNVLFSDYSMYRYVPEMSSYNVLFSDYSMYCVGNLCEHVYSEIVQLKFNI